MEILFFLSTLCLILFILLATYDGAYLHLFKYELFNREESHFEHKTHTVRALLFPAIVYLLFIQTSLISFYVGLILVLIDLIVLGFDAYSEEDSRSFMNGLPKWEYIIHLFANSFHFAAIILIVATRITINNSGIEYSLAFTNHEYFSTVQFIAQNIIPGALILGVTHLLLATPLGKKLYNSNRKKLTCC